MSKYCSESEFLLYFDKPRCTSIQNSRKDLYFLIFRSLYLEFEGKIFRVKDSKDFPNRSLYLWFIELSLWILVNYKLLLLWEVSQNLIESLPCYVGITLRPVPSHCLTTDINMDNRGSGLSSFCCWPETMTLLRLIAGHEKFRSLSSIITNSADLWVLCKSEQLSSYSSYRCNYNYILRVHRWIVWTFESDPCLSKVRVLRRLLYQLSSCLY